MSDILNEIKLLLIHNEMSMTELLNKNNEIHGKNDSLPNLHKKLSKETIRYTEIQEIAETLGYKIAWVPKETNLDHRNGIIFSTKIKRGKQQTGKRGSSSLRKIILKPEAPLSQNFIPKSVQQYETGLIDADELTPKDKNKSNKKPPTD